MFRATLQNSFITLQDVEVEATKRLALGSSVRAKSSDSAIGHRHLAGEGCCDKCVHAQLERLDGLMRSGLIETVTQVGEFESLKIPTSNCCRAASSSSISTMAPDEASECEHDIPPTSMILQNASMMLQKTTMMLQNAKSLGLRRELSMGSVCSQISEDSEEHFAEDPTQARLPKSSNKPQVFRESTDDFSHCHVPRHVNFAKEFAEKSIRASPPTTIMIRNIPNRLAQHQIMKVLERLGFAGTFDFFYAPMDKRTKCTVGYAFVNFLHHEVAARCMRAMERYCFEGYGRQGSKQARVSVAHIQGLEANVRHYENSAVNSNSNEHQCGPIIMPKIAGALAEL